MIGIIEWNNQKWQVAFNHPLDISIAMENGSKNPNAFGIQPPAFEPFKAGSFIGSTAFGGSVNCENLFLNPHGNGTHTECVGHISKERITIHETLQQFHFIAKLITVTPQLIDGDLIIKTENLAPLDWKGVEALIIRTHPNTIEKKTKQYSGNNPCYLDSDVCALLAANQIKHLIIDLPSVDREEDEGKLAAHHAFWSYPQQKNNLSTITEMAYIDNAIEDGLYLLNLQIASLQTDASPSKPVLYKLQHVL